jgi:hypothetical protein
MWKNVFIILTYANMNMKRTWQGYGVRSCLRLVLNKLQEMRGVVLLFIPFWGPNSNKLPKRFLCVHQMKKLFENLPI